ncbi:MAG TPA: hypothetical protein EYP31_00795 [Roseibacterium sp.]|nr:hypothetical protein [Roseibacterium sp.]
MTRFTMATLAVVAAYAAHSPTQAMAQFEAASMQAYRAADQDGDEHLTLTEFRVLIQDLAAARAPLSIRIRSFGAYRITITHVDLNRDRCATPAELRAAKSTN